MNALAARSHGRGLKPQTATAIASDLDAPFREVPAETYPWILHQTIDLFFCCGGIVWILYAAHWLCSGNSQLKLALDALIVTGSVGTILLGETHTIATLTRIYASEESELRFPLCARWLPLLMSGLALTACLNPAVPPILCKIYLLVVAHHFTAQTYGLVLLYCMKSNYQLDAVDRMVLKLLMQTTTIFAIARQLCFRSWSGETFLGQVVPFWGPLPIWLFDLATILVVFACCASALRIFSIWCRTKKVFPLPAMLLTFTGVGIFLAGTSVTQSLWLYVPAFFHGSQYLVLTTFTYMKEQGLLAKIAPNKTASMLKHRKTIRFLGFLVIAGIAVFIGIPGLLHQFGFNYAAAVAAIFTTVQFHHVITDGVIWRLKDARTRSQVLPDPLTSS